MQRLCVFFIACLINFSSWAHPAKNGKQQVDNAAYIHKAIKMVTDVMVHDIYSPPVASRIYAYVTIAGYEAAIPGSAEYTSFEGQLHDYNNKPKPEAGKSYNYSLASVNAILSVARSLIISEGRIEEFQRKILQEMKASGITEDAFNNSVSYGKTVADHVIKWAAGDNYKQTRSLEKYSVEDDEQTWKPTPPVYMRAVEPHWSKLRPFLIDSCQQFKPLPPTKFSKDSNSDFYKEALAVHDIGVKLTAQQKAVANFWDCNPFCINLKGHVMYATKKISPGGHWINITRIACKKAKADFVRSAEAYACVSLTLADGFISCWDEKYRSNVIRPETYINQYIDENWTPLLQTPPFPEYTSGHSVISTASAVVLTKLFGDNFSFADSSEVEFGLPVRFFKSFKEAAREAAISRFFGGIHYMPSIERGAAEGNDLGSFVAAKIRTRKDNTVSYR